MKKRSALLLGATGLIGSELLTILLQSEEYEAVTVLGRRELPIQHQKLTQLVIDFEQLSEYRSAFRVDDVYSCLGTTIKKAKSKANFEKVDYEYTITAATLASDEKATNFLTITSLGAHSNSLFFYNRVKGKVEDKLRDIELNCVLICQPSLLLGERDEWRRGEKFAEKVSERLPFLFSGPLKVYRPIEGRRVAKFMYEQALQEKTGFHIHPSTMMNT
ncbi:NAD(P)H-binding protein [Cytobacillus spongiae]|uniref:NAD(P)H-binding protein n=1 Tax=Cytobacillus spongiae TaxID=2901381 RepID=UPI001F3B1618|nr:NAD(P)H-binding protein [Cytobacillus spongiae]UII57738.1 NAD(P)H-binding protein [Cytobacillus spongiae]